MATYEERKAAADSLAASIEDQITQAATPEGWETCLSFMTRFYRYSLRNILLVLAQCPEATNTAGYRQWQKAGYQVRKGEKALTIFGYAEKKMTTEKGEDEEEKVRYFPMVSVFDFSQVEPIEGVEQTMPGHPALFGEDPEGHYMMLQKFITKEGWSVTESTYLKDPRLITSKGICATRGDKQIIIRSSLSPLEKVGVLLHEIAHALLHYGAKSKSREQKECEAEASAYCIAGALGLDIANDSIGYIWGWQQDNPILLKAALINIGYVTKKVLTFYEEQEHQEKEAVAG